MSDMKKAALTLALAIASVAPAWANDELKALRQQVLLLSQRLEQLERQLAQTETQTQTPSAQATAPADPDRLKERVAEVEKSVVQLQKPSRLEQATEGVTVNGSLMALAQQVNGRTGTLNSALNTRADLEIEVPAGQIGEAQGKVFAHLRAGDGHGAGGQNGLGLFASQNGTTFGNVTQPVLMQAWYQVNIPVGPQSDRPAQMALTAGKIDPFVFFDQNAIADDESESFMNLAFVHNPLLDAGGDIGVGTHGASPGLRWAYTTELQNGHQIGLSVGLFGAAGGANYDDTFAKRMSIAQLEYSGNTIGDLAGGYRLYVWDNGSASNAVNNAIVERHTGWGLSMDQQVSDSTTLFARYGKTLQGELSFDQALTLGAQVAGRGWGREKDRIGLAAGGLKAGEAYNAANGTSGSESIYELFYALHLNEHLQLTASLQRIEHPSANPSISGYSVMGLRAKVSF